MDVFHKWFLQMHNVFTSFRFLSSLSCDFSFLSNPWPLYKKIVIFAYTHECVH